MLRNLLFIVGLVIYMPGRTQALNGIAGSGTSTHVFNAFGATGYITFGFTAETGANTTTSDPLTIKQANLSVGINNNNPLASLHIKGLGATNISSSFLVQNSTNIELFRILDNGNVGIGTGNPQSALSVKGTITTQRIKVTQTGWPDYVFDKKYHLPSLQELEIYITRNRHLPGIASEEEVQKDGVDLGENQAAVLKKVEELTLYVIEQHKKMEVQQAKIEQQEIEMARLRKMIKKIAAHR